ncbi:DUF3953 domain-containing protein [Virgibacillus flavescens]|uniref:DUF3953 domain-containing protein n=1 Tax=Virgibacillus flavescens TaxID=1611422 RepID=UPI003D342F7E
MLKISRIILSVIVIAIAVYVLITKNFEFLPLMILFLSILIMVGGLVELQAKKKTNAIISILASTFLLFVAIYTF